MPPFIKALVVILVLAGVVFRLARPHMAQHIGDAVFVRRRNTWLSLTAIAFLSPSFWIFLLIAVPLIFWAASKDNNRIALYILLLHVISPVSFEIPPLFGLNLISLDMYRVLSLVVLVPMTLRRSASANQPVLKSFSVMNWALALFLLMQVILFVRPDSPGAEYSHNSFTNMLRNSVSLYMDVAVVYIAVSRSCTSQQSILDVMLMFCLSCALMTPIAIFESLRHWSVYLEMEQHWGSYGWYLFRDGVLRAQVSSGHALALGYLMALAIGFWLFLANEIASKPYRRFTFLLFGLGLWAAYSRAPWVGAVVIYLVFLVSRGRFFRNITKGLIVVSVGGLVLLATPLGDRISAAMPFLGGKVDSENIDYRVRLAARSLDIISSHPFFGDQDAFAKLEDLRQGGNIIDFVNSYAYVAVFYGLIGLVLFAGFLVLALVRVYRTARALEKMDPNLAVLGNSLCACLVGTLAMMASSSFIFGYMKMYYILAGLSVAYVCVGARVLVDGVNGSQSTGESRNYSLAKRT